MKVRTIIKEVQFAGDAFIQGRVDGLPILVKVCKTSLLPWLRSIKDADLPARRDNAGRLIIG